jgi:hypothetical protein
MMESNQEPVVTDANASGLKDEPAASTTAVREIQLNRIDRGWWRVQLVEATTSLVSDSRYFSELSDAIAWLSRELITDDRQRES